MTNFFHGLDGAAGGAAALAGPGGGGLIEVRPDAAGRGDADGLTNGDNWADGARRGLAWTDGIAPIGMNADGADWLGADAALRADNWCGLGRGATELEPPDGLLVGGLKEGWAALAWLGWAVETVARGGGAIGGDRVDADVVLRFGLPDAPEPFPPNLAEDDWPLCGAGGPPGCFAELIDPSFS